MQGRLVCRPRPPARSRPAPVARMAPPRRATAGGAVRRTHAAYGIVVGEQPAHASNPRQRPVPLVKSDRREHVAAPGVLPADNPAFPAPIVNRLPGPGLVRAASCSRSAGSPARCNASARPSAGPPRRLLPSLKRVPRCSQRSTPARDRLPVDVRTKSEAILSRDLPSSKWLRVWWFPTSSITLEPRGQARSIHEVQRGD